MFLCVNGFETWYLKQLCTQPTVLFQITSLRFLAFHFSFTFYINTHTHLIYINIIIYPKLIYSFYSFIYLIHTCHFLFSDFLYIHFILRLYIFHIFYVLSSKFNWEPVFKSQINYAFLPTMPNRTARGFFTTAGLYLAYNHLVVLWLIF